MTESFVFNRGPDLKQPNLGNVTASSVGAFQDDQYTSRSTNN